MKLYGGLLSPFVRKVAVALGEKGVDYTPARGGPGSTDAEFLAASPFAKIPAIDDEGFCLADSSAIVHYLEAKYPAPALLPADPQARGLAVWFDEFGDTIFAASGLKILFNRVVGPRLLGKPGTRRLPLRAKRSCRASSTISKASRQPMAGWSRATSRSPTSPSPRCSARSPTSATVPMPPPIRRLPRGTPALPRALRGSEWRPRKLR